MKRFLLAFAVLIAASASASATAQISTGPKVQARLVAEQGEIAPGKSVTVALEEVIKPGWHTYWSNPGEAGLPTEIKWALPAGWKAGAIAWPYPKRLPVGPLMNYGYENKVWLLITITAPADARPNEIATLKATADWLVCKEVCIPEDTALSLPLTVNVNPSAPYATVKEQFDAARAKIPVASPWPVTFHSGESIDVLVASPPLAKSQLQDVAFFPSQQGVIEGMATQKRATVKEGLALRLTPAKNAKIPKTLAGVLVLTSADGSVQALKVSAHPGTVPNADFGMAGDSGLLVALLFALIGGLILNLMPCVLPVLAMKALAIANQAHGEKAHARRDGFAYGAGAILSFMAIGFLLVALRAGGQAIGWGFQLQEPAVVAFFALLVFAVGLNLSSVFEIGNVAVGDALTRRGDWIGSFFTGILAVAVAAPCTAPFMAAALGYALTQSAIAAVLIFFTLGLGFASPFVLIGLAPVLLRFLPRPGAWMMIFKQLLAFPMYGAAVWLLWVLSQETGATGLLAALAAMLALAFAAWAWSTSRNASSAWRAAGMGFALIGLLGAAGALVLVHQTAAVPAAVGHTDVAGIPTEPYSASKLTALRGENRAVFVDATAAWCITCLVNEKAALSGAKVHAAFARKHIAYLVADWTNRNPEITALLAAHGRSGVPLYLYYAPGASDAVILPQVLTESSVLDAIGAK
ncbi:MAG: thioredoxin family protein [Proteobacteria bacterium]|nr:thioredoxin family protein [Pseudomonadota bacterium]